MNDDEYGVLLLRPLAGEPTGLPDIDVPRAMRDGRRMRRRLRWSAGGGLLAALIAALVTGGLVLSPAQHDTPEPLPDLPPEPVVPTVCQMALLPKGGHPSVGLTGGDSSGRWLVGTAAPVAGLTGPLLVWHDGKLVAQVPAPKNDATLHDINSAGVAVGSNNTWDSYPFVVRNGKITQLKGGRGQATAISDDGVIVGILGVNTRVPVRWVSADAEPERLPMPQGVQDIGYGVDIAPDGTVSGSNHSNTWLWLPDGSVRKITPASGTTAPGLFRPAGFAFGWLYGEYMGGAGIYRYEPHSGTWQQVNDATHGGQFPGAGGAGPWPAGKEAVFVGRQVLLLEEGALARDELAIMITAMSDDAHVVAGFAYGKHTDPDVPNEPIIWRCR